MGRGTEFKIYLPAVAAGETALPDTRDSALPTGNGELILIVDDEEAVRELAKSTLESYGYRVITAQNGVHGVACFEEYQDEIKLLVTDTDMPVLGRFVGGARDQGNEAGPPGDCGERRAAGHGNDAADGRRRIAQELPKPFSLEQLLTAVDLALQR